MEMEVTGEATQVTNVEEEKICTYESLSFLNIAATTLVNIRGTNQVSPDVMGKALTLVVEKIQKLIEKA